MSKDKIIADLQWQLEIANGMIKTLEKVNELRWIPYERGVKFPRYKWVLTRRIRDNVVFYNLVGEMKWARGDWHLTQLAWPSGTYASYAEITHYMVLDDIRKSNGELYDY